MLLLLNHHQPVFNILFCWNQFSSLFLPNWEYLNGGGQWRGQQKLLLMLCEDLSGTTQQQRPVAHLTKFFYGCKLQAVPLHLIDRLSRWNWFLWALEFSATVIKITYYFLLQHEFILKFNLTLQSGTDRTKFCGKELENYKDNIEDIVSFFYNHDKINCN